MANRWVVIWHGLGAAVGGGSEGAATCGVGTDEACHRVGSWKVGLTAVPDRYSSHEPEDVGAPVGSGCG